jgi:hypothetical protein
MSDIVKTFQLAPSDFGFLLKECPACYYDKYVNRIFRPRYSMPAIFTTIDGLMTSYYDNRSTKDISDTLQEGIITLGGIQVKSRPIFCKEYNCNIVIGGKVDSLMMFNDGTFGVIDFKTTLPKKTTVDFYFPQLMSYSVALEYNDPEITKDCKISKIGLCCFNPLSFDKTSGLLGSTEWIEIEKNKDRFKAMLLRIAKMLTAKEKPKSGENCTFCQFKDG